MIATARFHVRGIPVYLNWAFVFPVAVSAVTLLLAIATYVNQLVYWAGADAFSVDPPTLIWSLAALALPLFVGCLAMHGGGQVVAARRLNLRIKAFYFNLRADR
jgi:amino acid transporter